MYVQYREDQGVSPPYEFDLKRTQMAGSGFRHSLSAIRSAYAINCMVAEELKQRLNP
jgi:hypothetical protein